MSVLYGTKINQLLANTAPTGLLFADWLKKNDYSGQLQKKKNRDSGWLTAMCKGVMCRTGSRLNAYDSIASYNKQMGVRCCWKMLLSRKIYFGIKILFYYYKA